MKAQVRGWRKHGSVRGKWVEGEAGAVSGSRTRQTVRFSITRGLDSGIWQHVDADASSDDVRRFAESLIKMCDIVEGKKDEN